MINFGLPIKIPKYLLYFVSAQLNGLGGNNFNIILTTELFVMLGSKLTDFFCSAVVRFIYVQGLPIYLEYLGYLALTDKRTVFII